MAKKPRRNESARTGRTERVKLTAEETLKRIREFPKRKEAFIAAVRNSGSRKDGPWN